VASYSLLGRCVYLLSADRHYALSKTAKKMKWLFVMLALAGCSYHERIPSLSPKVASAVGGVVAVSKSLEKASGSLGKAVVALRSSSPTCKESPALGAALEETRVALGEAQVQANESRIRLEGLESSVRAQEGLLASATEERDKATEAAVKMEADRNKQRLMAWKWRLIAGVVVLLFGGFFVVRQYIPILKLI